MTGAERRPEAVCVALCTYDGASFVAEQLESIAAQTRLPDRLVVVDDASGDDTVSVVRRFAESAPFPVEVHVNARNLGYAANFARAAGLCRGEVVVLCDQDDVWVPAKLERLLGALDADPAAGAAFSDAELVDAALRPLHGRLWEAVNFFPGELRDWNAGYGFERLMRGNVVTGATLAFRAPFLESVLPLPPGVDHDAWIALVIAATSRLVPVAEPLVLYRQHGGNQIGARRLGPAARLRRSRRQGEFMLGRKRILCAAALERLQSLPGVPEERLLLLREALEHLDARASLPRRRLLRVPAVLRELRAGCYARQGSGWRSAARDLLV
ncbi:MAG: Alpha-L-Rha alpha-1,3-L-rhamnosyltransferase [uncultured Gemmatimonadetes bacterium]|uniref:Alpha-L-Rha alpha-1,3-L-rhamnosyltransferase n=1 Tax=uncultured Gemmatimonadota bacterium TaxID=203437 RepID=A0A6J4N3K5_9BACT|nr:MAG: Alpha-L-Rha alpha-1,3-L-rhamnosyltransferase [uncultured Gemmatimonadota bacterium]